MWNKPESYDENEQSREYFWRNFKGEDGLGLLAVEKSIIMKSALHKKVVLAQYFKFSAYLDMNLNEVKDHWSDQIKMNGIVANRCPNCEKIVLTPDSRECLWCG